MKLVLTLLLIAIAGGGAAYFFSLRPSFSSKHSPAPSAASIRVVHDRPGGARVGAGATISEPEAILRLRRSLNLPPDCVAILSNGYREGGYSLLAVNRCDGTRLGRWRVDGKSGTVSRPGR
jgi:hypothetical protein